jgi:hypothetical protein
MIRNIAVLGTMKNSFDNRCLAAGVRRDWAGWDNGWVFKGIYGYVGEFSLMLSVIVVTMGHTMISKK